MAHKADEEGTADVVHAEVVDTAMADVAEIAQAYDGASDREVGGEHLVQAECVGGMAHEQIVRHTVLRNLVITFSVMGD